MTPKDGKQKKADVRTMGQTEQNLSANEPNQVRSKIDEIKDDKMRKAVAEEIKRREKRRKRLIAVCMLLAIMSLGYFGFYNYMGYRTQSISSQWADLKEKSEKNSDANDVVVVHKVGEKQAPDILPEYQALYAQNKSLIGWLTVGDEELGIDYPVMQTSNNEYYLSHNFEQQYDKNGSIFMDTDCDVIDRSTNLIIYGHHMKSGNMFGELDRYADEDFYKNHPTFSFDTIYEKGIYQIVYVFRSQVYTEDTITFKYYQFINANSETEFDSNMQAMANMSLYDTGVTPTYGSQLVTLSTCDHSQTAEGRFVVVGMKIA